MSRVGSKLTFKKGEQRQTAGLVLKVTHSPGEAIEKLREGEFLRKVRKDRNVRKKDWVLASQVYKRVGKKTRANLGKGKKQHLNKNLKNGKKSGGE